MTLANCFFTMYLILAPIGADSTYEGMRLAGSCASHEIAPIINKSHELVVKTEWMLFVIPLPQRVDKIQLSYRMESEYAYLGSCLYGLKPYVYRDSSCQRVMVRFGPRQPA